MFGWNRRLFVYAPPLYLPRGVTVAGPAPGFGERWALPLFLLLLTFFLTLGARMLELPYWQNPAYMLGREFLLGTHDAYHWIAGAEGFEFGAGHPMSELARIAANITGMSPANVGFWLPPIMGALLASAVFLWAWALGHPFAGVAAGVTTSLSPGFFARTLLGFYDTDLVVLLFFVLLGLVPAIWLHPWLTSPLEGLAALWRKKSVPGGDGRASGAPEKEAAAAGCRAGAESGRFFPTLLYGHNNPRPMQLCLLPHEMQRSMLCWPWLLALMVSGLMGHGMQAWHSMFPYLVRFSALLLPVLILVLGPRGGRRVLLRGALCHVLPLLLGFTGFLAAILYSSLLCLRLFRRETAGEGRLSGPLPSGRGDGGPKSGGALLAETALTHLSRLVWDDRSLLLLWPATLLFVFDGGVFSLMVASFNSYVRRGGDTAAMTAAADPLIFPSVAESIIETQIISLSELLIYFYPHEIITFLCFLAFAHRLLATPVLVWFVPALLLSFFSLKMGGRMTMFGPAGLLLAFCLDAGLLLEWGLRRLRFFSPRDAGSGPEKAVRPAFAREGRRTSPAGLAARTLCCLAAAVGLSWPLVTLLPDYTQGPIISREQAEGLSYLKEHSPPESIVWNWWDWGYATHHFARRHTIADGARHGGPSLYIPAAVYTTGDARFARQLIKYTASKNNDPGDVFAGLSPAGAQELMRELGDKKKPLVEAPGRQYLVVSFDLLRLGLWVTRYGSWNFERKSGSGALMSNLSQALEFNLESGVVQPKGGEPVYPASIDLFEPTGLRRASFNRPRGYHFIFNPQTSDHAQVQALLAQSALARFWLGERGYFGFTAVTNDKMVVDDVYYNTMMVQLLLCDPDDPRFSPYFRLVFDNIYCRIYEVR